jgi:hypothetical protein
VRPKETVTIGGLRVTNRTANSIKVSTAKDGTLLVTDCCLEEQGK